MLSSGPSRLSFRGSGPCVCVCVNLPICGTYDLRAQKATFAPSKDDKRDRFFPPWNVRLHAYSHFKHAVKPLHNQEGKQLRACDLIYHHRLCDAIGLALKERDYARVNLFSSDDPLPHQASCDCDGSIREVASELYNDIAYLNDNTAWTEYVDKLATWLAEKDLPSLMKSLGATAILPFHLAESSQNPYGGNPFFSRDTNRMLKPERCP